MTFKEFLNAEQEEPIVLTDEEEQALLDENARLIAEVERLKIVLDTAQKTARKLGVKALFAVLDREYNETNTALYFELDDEQFAFISAEMLSFKSKKYPVKSVMIH